MTIGTSFADGRVAAYDPLLTTSRRLSLYSEVDGFVAQGLELSI
jgi:hypothetical protein